MPFTSPDGWRKIEADGTNLLSPDVFLAQNRFVVKAGKQEVFEGRWSARESQLSSVPGFLGFYMLRRDAAKADDGYNYISTSIWRDIDSFKNWQSSPNFASAHANAGQSAAESIYEAPPRVAFYEGKLALSSVKGA
jgi:heme-degrading monooxygenase HmoA